MQFEQFLLILALILPLFYKYSFWLYSIQLKEYRLDRFKEYIFTPQGKSALFNFWFLIELPLLLFSITIYIDKNLEHIIFPVIFYFLIFYNIFVIGKIFRGRILKPKLTGRLLVIVLLLLIGIFIDLFFLLFGGYWIGIYLFIMINLLFSPLILFFYILLSLPLINYKKNKQINSAISKSEKINDVIKIGITGSYGKSSVKEFLSSILEQNGNTLKTPENKNTEMSVSSLVLNKLNKKLKYFVAEMGAYKIGEISILGKIVNHKYGFLTAVGNQHIGLFGNQENIATGKFEIQESIVKNDGILYVNGDCEEILKYLDEKKLKGNIIKYGIKSENNLDATSKITSFENNKTKFIFEYKDIKSEFEINLIGEHNIVNITGVIAFCIDLGLYIKDIKKYLQSLKIPENTKAIIKINYNPSQPSLENGRSIKLILIDDTYNLSEAGLKSGLELFKNYSSDYTKILVLDDILELGKESENIHKNIGKKIAEKKLLDKVIFCGSNYRESFIEGLLKGGFEEENIITSLDEKLEKSVILFEGRNAKKYLIKIKK